MSAASPQISVVVPVRDEADNIVPLVTEIAAALAGEDFEIVYVDDGSRDDTPARLAAARASEPRLRTIRHRASAGQSAAILTGVAAARGTWIVTLDGDGQNDPADAPMLLARAREADAPALVAGWRVARRDDGVKRVSAKIANAVRGWVLGDDTPDTGCGLKVFRRETLLALPRFDHMHRFLPALVRRAGGAVAIVPVNHRPRSAGRSKYGVLNRLWVGIVDMIGVMWLQRRRLRPEIEENPR